MDKRKLLRRTLLAMLVGAAMLSLPRAKAADLGDTICPPGDRTDWYLNPAKKKVDRYDWIKAEWATLRFYCPQTPGVLACTVIRQDTLFGGTYGTVYAYLPEEDIAEAIAQHEKCHLLGWSHGPDYNLQVK